jgi:endonuclease/exonuclease/phosphatase (EEP) superfamily protein YafD
MPFHVRTLSGYATIALWLALCAPLGIGLAALSGIEHRWADILAQFTAAALLAALALTAVAAAARFWPVAIAGGLTSLVLLMAGAPQWFPPRGTPRPGAPVVTLYSANLQVINTDMRAMMASVENGQADIVVLVETPEPMLDHLDEILPDQPNRVVERGGFYTVAGTIIASRWPVRKVEALGGENHVAAVVQTPLGDVTVFAVHLTRPWPYQYQWSQITQVMVLDDAARSVTGPMILAGDFNSVSSARIGRMIRRDLDVVAAPGWPGTWPASMPSMAGMNIDQVYRSKDLALVDRRLGIRSGSDHRPVVTKLTLSITPPPP